MEHSPYVRYSYKFFAVIHIQAGVPWGLPLIRNSLITMHLHEGDRGSVLEIDSFAKRAPVKHTHPRNENKFPRPCQPFSDDLLVRFGPVLGTSAAVFFHQRLRFST